MAAQSRLGSLGLKRFQWQRRHKSTENRKMQANVRQCKTRHLTHFVKGSASTHTHTHTERHISQVNGRCNHTNAFSQAPARQVTQTATLWPYKMLTKCCFIRAERRVCVCVCTCILHVTHVCSSNNKNNIARSNRAGKSWQKKHKSLHMRKQTALQQPPFPPARPLTAFLSFFLSPFIFVCVCVSALIRINFPVAA